MGRRRGWRRKKNAWLNELDDLIRGVCGGFLFGIPLLYTMEVWWIGSLAEPVQKISTFAATFAGVFLLNRTAGFRQTKQVRLRDVAAESVEAMALGIVCAFCVLVLLREITWETSLRGALGKLIFEGMPFSIGVALARSLLTGERLDRKESEGETGESERQKEPANHNPALADFSAAAIGSTVFAFNIAPTDEIPMLAAAMSPLWLLAIMGASLLISYGIVFEAGFTEQAKRHQQTGVFQRPLSETAISYLVSLAVSALLLCFFHKLRWEDPWQMWLSHTLILGLPATVGGAAGRLIV